MDFELAAIRAITTRLPPISGAGRIANQCLRPLYLRRKRPPVEVVALGFKMTLDPHQSIDAGLLFYPQLYNRREFLWLRQRLKPGDMFVDVGAYIGIYALLAARITDRVIAIEANPAIYAKLVSNIRDNEAHVTAVNKGASDQRGTLPFFLQESGNLGGSSFVFKHKGNSVQVECAPLAEIAPAADFLKIDIEGMESRVLAPYLEQYRPHSIILESIHDRSAIDLCLSNGYRIGGKSAENVLLLSDPAAQVGN